MRYIKEIFHLEKVVLDAHDGRPIGNTTVVDASTTQVYPRRLQKLPYLKNYNS